MLLHLCRCGKPIQQGIDMCPACRVRYGSRHMIYNRQERSQMSAAFYCSRAWRVMRQRMIDVFDGIDILAYYEDQKLVEPDRVHHIVELEEDWDLRLAPFNLIPLSNANHTRVTFLYKAGPESMAACQKRLRELRDRWCADRGGIEKVFQAAGLVAPPFSVEKTPHGKI